MYEHISASQNKELLRLEEKVLGRVGAFKASGLVHVPGMPDTLSNWLHELEKHQGGILLGDEMTPDLSPALGRMPADELAVLQLMRAKYPPSDEDDMWELLYPS